MNSDETSAIVLVGGKSTRLGRDKASERLRGVSLLQRAVSAIDGLASEVLVVRARGQTLPEVESAARLRVVEDAYENAGPLGGLYTGLSAMTSPRALTVACDMPLLQPALLWYLLGLDTPEVDAVVPTNDLYLPEPLCAVYKTSCIAAVEAQLSEGMLKVALFLDKVRVRYVPPSDWRSVDPEGRSFVNVNREADLKRVDALLPT